MKLKDPILGEYMDVKLTPTEAAVEGMQRQEHRRAKCDRCTGRYDLADGGFICTLGRDSEKQRRMNSDCWSFKLDENKEHWKL